MIKKIFIWLLFGILLFLNPRKVELIFCDTLLNEEQINYEKNTGFIYPITPGTEQKTILSITAHIVRTSRGNGGIDEKEALEAVEKMNRDFSSSSIGFEICKFNYINKTRFYKFNKSDERLLNRNHVANTINIYFVNKIYSVEEGSICGYTYYPTRNRDYLIVSNSCVGNRTTLSHEMGHFFGLYHTHESQFGLELANGSNCVTSGDLICDTPADPGLRVTNVTSNCEYIGLSLDAAKLFYNPPVNNLMSYSRKGCRNSFSQNQVEKMQINYKVFKKHLKNIDISFTASDTLVVKNQPLVLKAGGGARYEWSTGDSTDLLVVMPDTSTMYSVNIYTNTGCVIYKQFFAEVIPEDIISADEIACMEQPAVVTVYKTKPRLLYQLTVNGSWYGEPQYGTDSTLNLPIHEVVEDMQLGILIIDELEEKVLQPQTSLTMKAINTPRLPNQVILENDTLCRGQYTNVFIPFSMPDVNYQLVQNGDTINQSVMGTGGTISLVTKVVMENDRFDLIVFNECNSLTQKNSFSILIEEDPTDNIEITVQDIFVDAGEATTISIAHTVPGLVYHLVKESSSQNSTSINISRKVGNGESISFTTPPVEENSLFCLYVIDEQGCTNFTTEQILIQVKAYNTFDLVKHDKATVVNVNLVKVAYVSVELRNLQGQKVADVVQETKQKGKHEIVVDGEHLNLPQSSYLLLILADGKPVLRKIIQL